MQLLKKKLITLLSLKNKYMSDRNLKKWKIKKVLYYLEINVWKEKDLKLKISIYILLILILNE